MKNDDTPDFTLPKGHRPYMVLEDGGTGPFSCAHCEFHSKEDGEHRCGSPHYQDFMGTSRLIDENGDPLDDPSRACSDWYSPI